MRAALVVTLGLVALAVALAAAALGHDLFVVGLPYPDPTPEQAAAAREDAAVTRRLAAAAAVAWLAAGLAAVTLAVTAVGRWLRRR